MRTHNLRKLMVVSIYILGLVTASFVGISFTTATIDENRNPTYSPLVDILLYNNTPPVIDGDLESYTGEWENATIQLNSFGVGPSRITLTIRVQTNVTHLFMGISYVSSIFVPINTTIPIGDSYNNESHTWFAIIFDNNFDERIGYSDDTADDVLLVNYRQEGAQDAYINGTTTNSMVLDLNMTGQENTDSALSTELDDFNDYIVSYEVVKELDSKDTIGKDISVKEGEPLRYMFIVHQNDTAIYNHTIIDNKITGWNTIKLETVHDYFSYIDELSDINILIYVSDSSNTVERNLTNIVTLIRAYGFNESVKKASEGFEITYDRMKNMDLVILIGSHIDLTRDEIDDMRYYVATGGSLYVLGDTIDHDSKINNLLSNFGFQTYNDTLYSKDIGINSTIEFDMNDMLDLPYFTETNILTNQSIDTIEYQGSAIIFDDDNGTLILGEGYYQFQEGDLYASINKSLFL